MLLTHGLGDGFRGGYVEPPGGLGVAVHLVREPLRRRVHQVSWLRLADEGRRGGRVRQVHSNKIPTFGRREEIHNIMGSMI